MTKKQKEKALDLALAIYRITKLFPKGEILVSQLRKTANEISGQITIGKNKEAIRNIKILLNYLQIAKLQNWTKEVNFVILEKEYNELIRQIRSFSKIKKTEPKSADNSVIDKIKINSRQKKILNYIKREKIARGADITGLFSEFSKRTIRNDLLDLAEKGIVTFWKEGRNCFYKKSKLGNSEKAEINSEKAEIS